LFQPFFVNILDFCLIESRHNLLINFTLGLAAISPVTTMTSDYWLWVA